ncbi:uncharacterized protein LTR77_000507 [Saxophila tyrrhenica]|uniref:HIT-type domain-containing protein n=1 Tax=Saxophila tyrrhenica TaxID=1690608 RepID=A0AAV9PQ29_9PEZI|nr:hypothetical protein LTR77_000507 [Saxophila tyrrhenica]
MVPTCGVCHEQESKYKCPVSCYKPHKALHDNEAPKDHSAQPPKDRPGTTQRVPKVDFTGFENDKDFKRLLARFPLLKVQLQAAYALTLEPGPEDARSWNRGSLPGFTQSLRGHRSRGRGRGFRGGRYHGGGRGGRDAVIPSERQHGAWTQAKGDKEALDVIKKMKESDGDDDGDAGEGVREFVQLCQIKFAPSTEQG